MLIDAPYAGSAVSTLSCFPLLSPQALLSPSWPINSQRSPKITTSHHQSSAPAPESSEGSHQCTYLSVPLTYFSPFIPVHTSPISLYRLIPVFSSHSRSTAPIRHRRVVVVFVGSITTSCWGQGFNCLASVRRMSVESCGTHNIRHCVVSGK